jgi:hypothetical protein
MATKIITRRNSRNITPDQADYRGHVLFDRTGVRKKEKTVRRMSPDVVFSLFRAQVAQQKIIG